jgi:hypothetical protein
MGFTHIIQRITKRIIITPYPFLTVRPLNGLGESGLTIGLRLRNVCPSLPKRSSSLCSKG